MSIRPLAAALLLLSCTRATLTPVAPAVVASDELHRVDCGTWSAVWHGEKPEAPAPAEYGVTRLEFLVDGTAIDFAPQSPLNFTDHGFGWVSPDCTRVALLESHYGPIHIGTSSRLSKQLRHESPFDEIEVPSVGAAAPVLSDLTWVSKSTLEFFASCCGGVRVMRVDLSRSRTAETVFEAPSAPSGVRRTPNGYEVIR